MSQWCSCLCVRSCPWEWWSKFHVWQRFKVMEVLNGFVDSVLFRAFKKQQRSFECRPPGVDQGAPMCFLDWVKRFKLILRDRKALWSLFHIQKVAFKSFQGSDRRFWAMFYLKMSSEVISRLRKKLQSQFFDTKSPSDTRQFAFRFLSFSQHKKHTQ